MFFLVLLGWVVFRANNMADALVIYSSMFGTANGLGELPDAGLVVLLVVAAWWAMVGPNAFEFHSSFQWKNWMLVPLAAAGMACIAIIVGGRDSPFLYFQF
jgi:D-alanyl-lipoteichoic acid acyltransferase DltB (MBOAT superfamily)